MRPTPPWNPVVPAVGRDERIAKGGRAVTRGLFGRISQGGSW